MSFDAKRVDQFDIQCFRGARHEDRSGRSVVDMEGEGQDRRRGSDHSALVLLRRRLHSNLVASHERNRTEDAGQNENGHAEGRS